MQVVTVNGVLKHCTVTPGRMVMAGYTTESAIEGLVVTPVSVLDPEDNTDARYWLCGIAPLTLLDETEINALIAGEVRRIAVAKLTDAELSVLGVSRE